MAGDWVKAEARESNASSAGAAFAPYMDLTQARTVDLSCSPTSARQPVGFQYRAAAGNRANDQAAMQAVETYGSVRFPVSVPTQYGLRTDLVPASELEGRLDGMDYTARDDAALHIVERLKRRGELGLVASDPAGRRILVRLYDELTSDSVWDDERQAAEDVALALKRTLDPKAFTRLAGPNAVPVIPISSDFLTHGSWVQARLLPSGKIFIKPSASVEDWNVRKNYPEFFEYAGAEFEAMDVLQVVQLDVSPAPQPMLAAELLALANATEYGVLKNATNMAILGASAPFSAIGMGGRALAGKLITTGVSKSAMLAARLLSAAVELGDVGLVAWGAMSSVVHLIEGGLVRRFGEDAKALLGLVHVLDTIMLVYGFSRVTADVVDLVLGIRSRSAALRDAARESAQAGSDDLVLAGKLDEVVAETDKLSAEQQKLVQALDQAPAGKVGGDTPGPILPSTAGGGAATAPVGLPAFPMKPVDEMGLTKGSQLPFYDESAAVIPRPGVQETPAWVPSPEVFTPPATGAAQAEAFAHPPSLRRETALEPTAFETPAAKFAGKDPRHAEQEALIRQYDKEAKVRRKFKPIATVKPNAETADLLDEVADFAAVTESPAMPLGKRTKRANAGTDRSRMLKEIIVPKLRERGLEGKIFSEADYLALEKTLGIKKVPWKRGKGPDVLLVDLASKPPRVWSVDLATSARAEHFAQKAQQMRELGQLLDSTWNVRHVADFHVASKISTDVVVRSRLASGKSVMDVLKEFGFTGFP